MFEYSKQKQKLPAGGNKHTSTSHIQEDRFKFSKNKKKEGWGK